MKGQQLARKEGKKFEKELTASLKDGHGRRVYRITDPASSYGGSERIRFAVSGLCDMLLKTEHTLWCLELKTTKAKSIPKPRQHEKMLHNTGPGLVNAYVINFRTFGKTYCVPVKSADKIFQNKKSINLDDCASIGRQIISYYKPRARTTKSYEVREMFLSDQWVEDELQEGTGRQ